MVGRVLGLGGGSVLQPPQVPMLPVYGLWGGCGWRAAALVVKLVGVLVVVVVMALGVLLLVVVMVFEFVVVVVAVLRVCFQDPLALR